MAASLTELWSRLKLPASAPGARAAAAEAEALRRRLISRAESEAAATWLAQRPHLGQDVFRRGQPRPNADAADRGETAVTVPRRHRQHPNCRPGTGARRHCGARAGRRWMPIRVGRHRCAETVLDGGPPT
jgi:segregation and condensation protein A